MAKKNFFKNTIGAWIQLDSLTILKIVNTKKFDWICFDIEHGCSDLRNITKYLHVLNNSKKKKLIRININEKSLIPQMLDQGIDGVIVANISSAKEVMEVHNLCNYPPKGKRGLGYSNSNNFNFKNINVNFKPYLIPIIENKNAIKNIDEICSLKVIDGIFIGPVDLSMSLLGKIDFGHKNFKSSIKKVLNSSKKNKVICGSHLIEDNKNYTSIMKTKGYDFLAYSTDSFIINKYYSV